MGVVVALFDRGRGAVQAELDQQPAGAPSGERDVLQGRPNGFEQAAEPQTRQQPAGIAGASSMAGRASELGLNREAVLERERARFGGVKWGSAFFGWLTATGIAVLLTALIVGAGAAVGVAGNTTVGQAATQATNQAQQNATTVGIASGIGVLLILFLAYYCGGYVAGRMARFNGVMQGVAVWIWAIVIAIIVGVIGAIAGSKYNVLGSLNSFPRIPIKEGGLTTGGVVTLLLAAAISLVAAVLGGLAGMRFHRKVDRAGLTI
jgi:MFS family permease